MDLTLKQYLNFFHEPRLTKKKEEIKNMSCYFPFTPQHPYELRIDFRVNGQRMFAEYSTFRIEDESDKYGKII